MSNARWYPPTPEPTLLEDFWTIVRELEVVKAINRTKDRKIKKLNDQITQLREPSKGSGRPHSG